MNLNKNCCLNCNKKGHKIKVCTEPITSYGIICFSINNCLKITNKKIENFFYNKFLELSEYNYMNLNNINMLTDYYNDIKIIIIRRKYSLNYVEFIRGKYDINDKLHIKKLLELMSLDENLKIKNTNFDDLWIELWNKPLTNNYTNEYKLSKNKFESLQINNFYNYLEDNLSVYLEPEWEFPKGRKNYLEKNIECAKREFNEETNIKINDIHILERLKCLEEIYKGTNNLTYKHVYYLAAIETLDLNLSFANMDQSYEVSDIKIFTISEVINKMRPYNIVKIKLIHQIYFFIINLINNINQFNNNNIYI